MIRALRVLRSVEIIARDPAELESAEVDALYAFCTTMIDRDREEFGHTLAQCDRLYEVRRGERIVGMTTIRSSQGVAFGREAVVVEAKWAWLAPEVRGAHLPPLLTFRALRDVWQRYPGRDTYGMLTAATEHSFLMVHRYVPRAWPHPNRPTPPEIETLLDAALTRHVGQDWDRDAGVVRGRGVYRYRVPQRILGPTLVRSASPPGTTRGTQASPTATACRSSCPSTPPNSPASAFGQRWEGERPARRGAPTRADGPVALALAARAPIRADPQQPLRKNPVLDGGRAQGESGPRRVGGGCGVPGFVQGPCGGSNGDDLGDQSLAGLWRRSSMSSMRMPWKVSRSKDSVPKVNMMGEALSRMSTVKVWV